MRDNIISYFDMCIRENTSLQRGMNFRLHGKHSVILMSVRENAPYQDRLEDSGSILIYEGHDVPRTSEFPDPKLIDQPEFLSKEKLTENGKFHKAAQGYQAKHKGPDVVRVYEKIKKGIWADNGLFHLIDSWKENDGRRSVFKFKLVALESDDVGRAAISSAHEHKHSRVIPTSVKLKVWQRDGGKCVKCGATDELHFDHIIPYSKGGTSLKEENVQILCSRHNIAKKANIE